MNAKGAWIELIVAMWDTAERGTITDDLDGYARLLGCSAEQAKSCIDEISHREICDREDLPDGRIKIICRRMVIEEKGRVNGRDRQNTYRNKHRPERGADEHQPDGDLSRESNGGRNGEVTPMSHASSYSYSSSVSQNNTPLPPVNRGESSKSTRKKRGKPLVPLPDIPPNLDTSAFREVWDKWLKYRRERNKTVTPMSASMTFEKLEEMGVANAIIAIRESIANNWTGIFAPKTPGGIPIGKPKTIDDVLNENSIDDPESVMRLAEEISGKHDAK